MKVYNDIKKQLQSNKSHKDSTFLASFWKTRKGEYAEGDIVWWVTVPTVRRIAQEHLANIDQKTLELLLQDPIHDLRLFALISLVYLFNKHKKYHRSQETIVKIYLDNIDFVNHRDLVDTSCRDILGTRLLDKDRSLLYTFAQSGQLRKQRIAIVTTRTFLKAWQADDTIEISKILLNHPHDLIHKAVWRMLREMGKLVDRELLIDFLDQHAKHMPSTMRSYATEHLAIQQRKKYKQHI